MGRRRQPQIREQILEACTDHALEHGLPNRLEPFATAAATSTRMLIYHFGTRDALLREVLGRARRRQRDAFGDLLRPKSGEAYPQTLRRAWLTVTGPAGQPYLRVFGRLREDAEQQLWPGFRREATTDWLAPLTEGLDSIGRPELATVVLAVIRGLILDLEATADTTRVNDAFTDFVDTVSARATPDPGRRQSEDPRQSEGATTSGICSSRESPDLAWPDGTWSPSA